jgi:hypothetical protein
LWQTFKSLTPGFKSFLRVNFSAPAGYNLLETAVFIFRRLQSFQLTVRQAGVFRPPEIAGNVVHPIPVAEINDLSTGLMFPEHGNNLFLGVLADFPGFSRSLYYAGRF